jgi:acetoin utilization deacetylase AcuC-like enzyme
MAFVILSSDQFEDHLTPPGHPESPERADVLEGVAERARASGVAILEPREADDAELTRVHTWSHVAAIESTRGQSVMIDADTFTCPDTARVARLAAGAAVMATEERSDALVLVRPPGHHAEPGQAMGFCFYNNIAVAAAAARAAGIDRVAIVDIDVHHGNGTQAAFWDDDSVLFISLHQWPFYPGSGGPDEQRETTVNVPMSAGSGDDEYLHAFEHVVEPALARFAPELVLVSAGFDAHADDPLADMNVTADGFREMAHRCRDGAPRVAAVLEGGYRLDTLPSLVDAALDGFACR